METLLLLALIIWLIVLQVTVNRLQDKLDRVLNLHPTTEVKPAPTVAPIKPVPSTPAKSPVKAVPPQPAKVSPTQPVAALVSTHEEKKQPKPTFEITAAKLFSWLGGFMLFLGFVFGIKYAVENHFLLLSPTMRIIISSFFGLCLAGCGYAIKNEKYRITSHTLLGSGLAVVYASAFCAHSFYQLISLPVAFVLMGLISFLALGSSLHKNAKYVGYLGAVIAFLTPVLLNNGQDAWVAFFLYVFCINAASAYAAVKKGWYGLFICTLSFTWLSQATWLFPLQIYKLTGVAGFFSLYALASSWLVRRQPAPSKLAYASATFLCMDLLLMIPAAACLQDVISSQYVNFLATGFPEGANFPGPLIIGFQFLGYVLLTNALVLVLAGRKLVPYWFARTAKALSFLVLFVWMEQTHVALWFILVACLIFTLLNSALELLPRFSRDAKPDGFSAGYPVAMIGSIWIISLLHGQVALTDFVCLFGLLGLLIAITLVVAVYARLLWMGIIAAVLLFIFLIGQVILGIGGAGFSPLILLSGLLPICLCSAVLAALRRAHKLEGIPGVEKAISAVTALMPFVLIFVASVKAHTAASLGWIWAVTWLVCAVNVIAARFYQNTYTLPVAVIGTFWIQLVAWSITISGKDPFYPLTFGIGAVAIFGLFLATPFLSRERLWNKNGTWVACSLAGLSACLWISLWTTEYAPQLPHSTVSVILLIIYARLLHLLWGNTQIPQGRPVSVGFISGAVLLFLTLIFPIEIHNHWLAVAWAGEAVFLVGLHKRLPYMGWKIGTAVLLGIVACMLLFLPCAKIAQGLIWNWYLWVYGLCALAYFVCARWWPEPGFFKNAFYAAGAVALFWLLNTEIAHWFSVGNHKYLRFEFTGQLAQALAYTLGWALFGLATIGIGLKTQKSAVSKAGIGVVGLALAKFFLSDIWQLEAVYRIIGLFGLAVMLIVASFWYQRKKVVK